jgi:LacI family transcriptional regulator
MTSKAKKVLLEIETARGANRGVLQGIIEYCRLHNLWAFYRDVPLYGKPPFGSGTVDPDGIIGFVPESKLHRKPYVNKPLVFFPLARTVPGIANLIEAPGETGQMAAEYLLAKGFKHFAYCGLENMYWSGVRCEGFRVSIENVGYEVCVYKKPKTRNLSKQTEREAVAAWLKTLPRPVGLFTVNDDIAQQIVEICINLAINVPEEIAILGVDNDEFICELTNPPLSSIKLNFKKAGYEAAELLDKLMNDRNRAKHDIIVHPEHIITRQSTDISQVQDPDVKSALQFIYANIVKPIQASDVLAVLPSSRRYVEQRFRRELGRSIYQEITRARAERIATMLVTTDISVEKIATDMGYPSANHLSRFFRHIKGMTPTAYRRIYGSK